MNTSYSSSLASSTRNNNNRRLDELEEERTLLGEVFADDSTCGGNTEFTFGTTQTELGFRKYLESTPSIDVNDSSSLEHSLFSECPSATSMSLGSFETADGSTHSPLLKRHSAVTAHHPGGAMTTPLNSLSDAEYYEPVNSIDDEGSTSSVGAMLTECNSKEATSTTAETGARIINVLRGSPRDTQPKYKFNKEGQPSILKQPLSPSKQNDDPISPSSEPRKDSTTTRSTKHTTDVRSSSSSSSRSNNISRSNNNSPLDMTLFLDADDDMDIDIREDHHRNSKDDRNSATANDPRSNWKGFLCRSFCESFSFVDCAGQQNKNNNIGNSNHESRYH